MVHVGLTKSLHCSYDNNFTQLNKYCRNTCCLRVVVALGPSIHQYSYNFRSLSYSTNWHFYNWWVRCCYFVAIETLSEAVKILKGELMMKAIDEHQMDQAIIFCRTKLDCDNAEAYLTYFGGGMPPTTLLLVSLPVLRLICQSKSHFLMYLSLPEQIILIDWPWLRPGQSPARTPD